MRQRPGSIPSRVLIALAGVSLLSCFLCCGGGMFIGWWGIEQDKKRLAEANRQWDAGQKADAVAAYKKFIKRDSVVPSDAERPTVYLRVIEYDLEQGNPESAKAVVEKGLDKKVDFPAGTKAMTELVAQVRADRQRREAEALARREADEKKKEDREADAKRRDDEREAEAKTKRDKQAAKEKQAEEEYEKDGLVLLKNSVNGTTNQFGCDITGTVVNRSGKKFKYAQITFNLYDASGARIGSALANINSLEAGESWNFKAVGLVRRVETYKFSELSGF